MQLGRYTVVKPLGEGGMATVFLATSPTGERVVLKIPHTASPETMERVRDEARIGIRLSHPNIVETLDLFQHEGKPILVVAYVEGASLKDARARGAMPAGAVARIGRQIADALHAIHEATDERGQDLGILHRDVAPGNILLNVDGDAQLIDLGIARSSERRQQSTGFGQVKGTFRYLAPEIFFGKGYSVGSDLWALGVTLFEALVGRKAASGGDQEILSAIVGGRILALHDDERAPQRLLDALGQLAAPAEQRFTNAAAAARVFASLEAELGDTAALARGFVARLPQGDNLGEAAGDDEGPIVAGADPGGDDWDKSSVMAIAADDKTTGSMPTIAPAVDDRAPTMNLPMVKDADLRGPPTHPAGGPQPITFSPERPAAPPARAPSPDPFARFPTTAEFAPGADSAPRPRAPAVAAQRASTPASFPSPPTSSPPTSSAMHSASLPATLIMPAAQVPTAPAAPAKTLLMAAAQLPPSAQLIAEAQRAASGPQLPAPTAALPPASPPAVAALPAVPSTSPTVPVPTGPWTKTVQVGAVDLRDEAPVPRRRRVPSTLVVAASVVGALCAVAIALYTFLR